MKRLSTLLFLAAFGVFASCQYKKDLPVTEDCSGTVSFSQDVEPIIENNCAIAGCHNATSVNKGGPFTSFSLIKNKALTIKQQVVAGIMPQTGSLNAAQIKTIRCWVDSGAPDN